MAWLEQVFEDKKFLGYLVKVSIVFGPGFLLIGYFERSLFLQLDWFKLLAFCGLFSVCLVGPLIALWWLLLNVLPAYYGWKLTRVAGERLISKNRGQIEESRKLLLSVTNSGQLTAEEKEEIDKILKRSQELDERLDKLSAKVSNARQQLSRLHIDLMSVLTDNWTLFGMLFLFVFVWVAVDYLSNRHMHIRVALLSLGVFFYLELPLVSIGTWLIYINKYIKKLIWRLSLELAGVAVIIAAILIWNAAFNRIYG